MWGIKPGSVMCRANFLTAVQLLWPYLTLLFHLLTILLYHDHLIFHGKKKWTMVSNMILYSRTAIYIDSVKLGSYLGEGLDQIFFKVAWSHLNHLRPTQLTYPWSLSHYVGERVCRVGTTHCKIHSRHVYLWINSIIHTEARHDQVKCPISTVRKVIEITLWCF